MREKKSILQQISRFLLECSSHLRRKRVTAEVHRRHVHPGVSRADVIVNDRAILGPLAAIGTLEARRFAALVLLVPLQILAVDVSSAAAQADEPLVPEVLVGET